METLISPTSNAYERAASKVTELKKFYTSLAIFVLVCGGFTVYKVLFGSSNFGYLWIAAIWGTILAVRAIRIFAFNHKWEERKIQEILNDSREKPTTTN